VRHYVGELAIVEASAFQTRFVELETQRFDQVQASARVGTEAYDVAGVRRYLRLIQYKLKHEAGTLRRRRNMIARDAVDRESW
jgi:hypothetical protein